jgi:hypothetical protein
MEPVSSASVNDGTIAGAHGDPCLETIAHIRGIINCPLTAPMAKLRRITMVMAMWGDIMYQDLTVRGPGMIPRSLALVPPISPARLAAAEVAARSSGAAPISPVRFVAAEVAARSSGAATIRPAAEDAAEVDDHSSRAAPISPAADDGAEVAAEVDDHSSRAAPISPAADDGAEDAAEVDAHISGSAPISHPAEVAAHVKVDEHSAESDADPLHIVTSSGSASSAGHSAEPPHKVQRTDGPQPIIIRPVPKQRPIKARAPQPQPQMTSIWTPPQPPTPPPVPPDMWSDTDWEHDWTDSDWEPDWVDDTR